METDDSIAKNNHVKGQCNSLHSFISFKEITLKQTTHATLIRTPSASSLKKKQGIND